MTLDGDGAPALPSIAEVGGRRATRPANGETRAASGDVLGAQGATGEAGLPGAPAGARGAPSGGDPLPPMGLPRPPPRVRPPAARRAGHATRLFLGAATLGGCLLVAGGFAFYFLQGWTTHPVDSRPPAPDAPSMPPELADTSATIRVVTNRPSELFLDGRRLSGP